MALGRTALHDIEDSQMTLQSMVLKLDDCWNTFQYVIRYLEEYQWADETVVGANVRRSSTIINDNLKMAIEEIKKLATNTDNLIANFVGRQNRING